MALNQAHCSQEEQYSLFCNPDEDMLNSFLEACFGSLLLQCRAFLLYFSCHAVVICVWAYGDSNNDGIQIFLLRAEF